MTSECLSYVDPSNNGDYVCARKPLHVLKGYKPYQPTYPFEEGSKLTAETVLEQEYTTKKTPVQDAEGGAIDEGAKSSDTNAKKSFKLQW